MAAANAPVKSNLGRLAIFIGYGPFRLFWEGWHSLVDTLRPVRAGERTDHIEGEPVARQLRPMAAGACAN